MIISRIDPHLFIILKPWRSSINLHYTSNPSAQPSIHPNPNAYNSIPFFDIFSLLKTSIVMHPHNRRECLGAMMAHVLEMLLHLSDRPMDRGLLAPDLDLHLVLEVEDVDGSGSLGDSLEMDAVLPDYPPDLRLEFHRHIDLNRLDERVEGRWRVDALDGFVPDPPRSIRPFPEIADMGGDDACKSCHDCRSIQCMSTTINHKNEDLEKWNQFSSERPFNSFVS